MNNFIGESLGQYRIINEIARGGMAAVYLAEQASLGREVAIKVLPPHFMHDTTFLARFSREVDVISKLQHPHILPVYDYGEHDGVPYIVTAYIPGGTLTEIVKQAPVAPNEILRYIKQLADALDFAHSKNIIHRDLKPGNVLLDERQNVYLADFGLAKIAEVATELTGNAIVGTPTYMAPEQSGPGEVTAATDVYALAIIVFQMLTGVAPYDDPSGAVILMAHLTKPIPNIQDHRPDLSDAVHNVIIKAMAKKPSERYQSAGELYAALESALTGKDSSEYGAVGGESPHAFLITNMLGQVIFVDGQGLKMLKRHHSEARTIIGKQLADVLGSDPGYTNEIVNELAKEGEIVDRELFIADAKGKEFAVMFSAVATTDDKGSFVGADVTLRKVVTFAVADSDSDSFHTAEQHLNTREELVLQTYFATHIEAIYKMMTQWMGKRSSANLERIINETAERNVWAVKMIDGHVTVQFDRADSDIYRALMAKGVTYAISVIGKKSVRSQIESTDKKMDSDILEFANALGLRDVFDDLYT
jgi:serine/threonine-protein kinase